MMENNITKRSYTRPCIKIVKVEMGNSMLDGSITANTGTAETLDNGALGAKSGGMLFDDEDDSGGWGNSRSNLWDE